MHRIDAFPARSKSTLPIGWETMVVHRIYCPQIGEKLIYIGSNSPRELTPIFIAQQFFIWCILKKFQKNKLIFHYSNIDVYFYKENSSADGTRIHIS